ncbi:hypothetical protein GcC1_200006 [Golovinomyces cichoracearum]|uniref:DH domain-containing protein n=1 Tax=Golovinomyces cichoracearum TaxID=62708 RepID=A0A420HEM2_9PEZI|nr:hypothetical protein GcC1_200006 [Golovinomyces cichoracearum]
MENDFNEDSLSHRPITNNHILDQSPRPVSERISSRPSKVSQLTPEYSKSTTAENRSLPVYNRNSENQNQSVPTQQSCGTQSRSGAIEMVTTTSDLRSAPTVKLNEIGTTNYSFWTSRTNLKTPRSISSPHENKSCTSPTPLPPLNGRSIIGKPSVKSLLRRFDSSRGDHNTNSLKQDDNKGAIINGKVPSGILVQAKQRDSASNCKSMSLSRLPTATTLRNKQIGGIDPGYHQCISSNPTAINYSRVPKKEYSNMSSPKNSTPSFCPSDQKLLFGEIPQLNENDSKSTYDLAQRTRGTSDPVLESPKFGPRTFTPYPATLKDELADLNGPDRFKAHNRNHSDFADTKVNIMQSLESRSPTTIHTSKSSISLNSKNPVIRNRLVSSSTAQYSPNNHSNPHYTNSSHLTHDQQLLRIRNIVAQSLESENFRPALTIPDLPTNELQSSQSRHLRTSSTNKLVKMNTNTVQTKYQGDLICKHAEEVTEQRSYTPSHENVHLVSRRGSLHVNKHRVRKDEQPQSLPDNTKFKTEKIKPGDSEREKIDASTIPLVPTSFKPPYSDKSNKSVLSNSSVQGDSPTLGLPGSFVDDDDDDDFDDEISPTHRMSRREIEIHEVFDTNFNPSLCDIKKISLNLPAPKDMLNLKQDDNREVEINENKSFTGTEDLSNGYSVRSDYHEEDIFPSRKFHDEKVLLRDSLLSNLSTEDLMPTNEKNRNIENNSNGAFKSQSHCLDLENNDIDEKNEDKTPKLSENNRNLHSEIDDGECPATVTELFYGSSEKFVTESEDHSAISSQEIFSKHSSWETSCSIGIENDHFGQEFLINDPKKSPILDEERPTPPKDSRTYTTISQQNNNSSISPCFQDNHNSPQLPPVATGDGFTLTFLRTENPHSGALPIQKWPPDFAPPPPPPLNYQRSASSPVRRSSSSTSSISRPFSGLYIRTSDSRSSNEELGSRISNENSPRREDKNLENSEVTTVCQPETEEAKREREQNRKRLYQRKMAIKELVDTESVYFKDMNVVQEIYKGTAEACPSLEPGDIKTIFRNTEEIVSFSNKFLEDLKYAALPIYNSRRKSKTSEPDTTTSTSETDRKSVETTLGDETEEQRDRETFVGASFRKHLPSMQVIYTKFLKNSESASSRLLELQKDPAVKVWLSECNTVAKDLTAAWDLDALLVKPVQRITRYQLLLKQIQLATPESHPDFEALQCCCQELFKLLKNIDDLKKRIHVVAKIVGRKRKESDVVRTGIAKAFGRRSERLHSDKMSLNRAKDDEEYLKMFEKFGDDYLRLQVVLRDAEYYTRQISIYVSDYLRYFSAIELIMRMSVTRYPDIESKWARFNVSMREIGTLLVEDHISEVRKFVIEPFEKTISAYDGPLLAMKKRDKRKVDYEKAMTLKSQGKKIDEKLQNLINEYSALHETLKCELPKLSQLTEGMGKVILERLVFIQVKWYGIWVQKVQTVFEENDLPRDVSDIVDQFSVDYNFEENRLMELSIINGNFGCELSCGESRSRSHSRRVSDLGNLSQITSTESSHSKQPSIATINSYRNQLPLNFQTFFNTANTSSVGETHNRGVPGSPLERFSTRSFTPDSSTRSGNEHKIYRRRESGSNYGSYHEGSLHSTRPLSGIFNSALPLGENNENIRSRGSSRDKNNPRGYTVLYLAASLFEFNVSATKQEAGYPYLTYQAGEIFDVIGEKGELWLAKNQDDSDNTVGWIWSKHFARLAAS